MADFYREVHPELIGGAVVLSTTRCGRADPTSIRGQPSLGVSVYMNEKSPRLFRIKSVNVTVSFRVLESAAPLDVIHSVTALCRMEGLHVTT
jgi:hypothetical protein